MTEEDPLARLERTAKETIARYQRFRDDTEAMTATATSPDGAVEVTVAPTGALRDLKLHAKARQYSMDKLAATILAATAAATRAAAASYTGKAEEFLGPKLSGHLRGGIAQQLWKEQP